MRKLLFILAVLLISLCLTPTYAGYWTFLPADQRTQITNLPTSNDAFPINITLCGTVIHTNPTLANGDSIYVYQNSSDLCHFITIGNSTSEIPWKNTSCTGTDGAGCGYRTTALYAPSLSAVLGCDVGSSTTTKLYDSRNRYNATTGISWNLVSDVGGIGQSCYFNGTNYANITGAVIDYSQAFTYVILSKATLVDSTTWQRIIDSGWSAGNWPPVLALAGSVGGDSGKIRVLMYDGSYRSFYSDAITPNNTWVWWAVRYAGGSGEQSLWKNGVKQAATQTGYAITNRVGTRIGAGNSDTPAEFFRGYLDEIRFYNASMSGTLLADLYGASNGTFMTLGSTSYKSESSISIIPIGTTYAQNFTGWFYFNSTSFSSSSCQFNLDYGTFTAISGNATNATLKSFNISTITGNHILNVTCEAPTASVSSTSNFSVIDYAVISDIYASTNYESNTSTFFLNINASDRISTITANLSWNGTILNANGNAVGSLWGFNVSKPVPLIPANTSISTWWNFIITYTNSSYLGNTTSSHTINLNQSYLITAINKTPSVVLEGDTIILQTQISKTPVDAATIDYVYFTVDNQPYLATLAGSTATYSIYSASLAASVATGGASAYNSTFRLTFNGTSLNKTSTTNTYSVSPIEFTNCSAGTNSTTRYLTFVPKDEGNFSNTALTFAPIEFSIEINRGIVSKEFNFSYTNETASICLYPPNATITANATIRYTATGYNSTFATRYYYLVNAQLTNSTQTVNLYNINSTQYATFVFTLVDNNRNKVSGAILDVQRYYPGLKALIAVAMGQTDYSSGSTNINLVPSENLYAVTIFQGGVNVSTLYPVSLTDTEITLVLSPQDFTTYPSRSGAIVSSCSNTTDTLSCTFADSSGLNPTITLRAIRPFALTNITVCVSTVTGNAGTLICPLGNTTNTIFSYTLIADYSDSMHLLLDSGAIYFIGAPQFKGADGTFLTLVLVVVAGLMFINSATSGIIAILLALTISKSLSIVDISMEAMAALYVAGAVLIYRFRY